MPRVPGTGDDAGLTPAGLAGAGSTGTGLRRLAGELVEVRGVVAVLLGGSRARGEHLPGSDVDLGLYYRPPLDVAGLRAVADRFAGAGAGAALTEPGGWGPWVDGGGWLEVAGTAVDWLYRDVDRVQRAWVDAQAGRHAWHVQAGHPLGFLDVSYAGEVALGVVLADPTGEVGRLQQAARDYPPALGAGLVHGLWEARLLVDCAGKGVARGDAAYVAGCLFRAVGLCAHAVHGHAGRWLLNEKGAVAAAGTLPGAPVRFAERVQAVLGAVGTTPSQLAGSVAAVGELVAETVRRCGDAP